jgi:hypothetical protein
MRNKPLSGLIKKSPIKAPIYTDPSEFLGRGPSKIIQTRSRVRDGGNLFGGRGKGGKGGKGLLGGLLQGIRGLFPGGGPGGGGGPCIGCG